MTLNSITRAGKRRSALRSSLLAAVLSIFISCIAVPLALADFSYAIDVPGNNGTNPGGLNAGSSSSTTQDADIIKQHEFWDEHMSQNGAFESIARTIGAYFVKCLATVINTLEAGMDKMIGFISGKNSVFKNAAFLKYYNALRPIIYVLLGVSIVMLGYFLLFKRSDTGTSMGQSAVIVLVIMIGLPQFMGVMGELTAAVSGDIKNAYTKNSKAATVIVNQNTIDYLALDAKYKTGMPQKKADVDAAIKWAYGRTKFTDFAGKRVSAKLSDTIDDKTKGLNNKKFFTTYISEEGGKNELYDIDSGIITKALGIDKNWFRYDWNFWTIMFMLGGMMVTLFFTLVKFGKIVVELVMNMFIMPGIAVTDLATGQKTKEMIKHVLALFASFALIYLLLGIYFSFTKFFVSLSLGGVEIVMFIVLCAAIIDGPNIIERILGVDAGIKSGYHTAMGALVAARTVKGGIAAPFKTASGLRTAHQANKVRKLQIAKYKSDLARAGAGGSSKGSSNIIPGKSSGGGMATGGGSSAPSTPMGVASGKAGKAAQPVSAKKPGSAAAGQRSATKLNTARGAQSAAKPNAHGGGQSVAKPNVHGGAQSATAMTGSGGAASRNETAASGTLSPRDRTIPERNSPASGGQGAIYGNQGGVSSSQPQGSASAPPSAPVSSRDAGGGMRVPPAVHSSSILQHGTSSTETRIPPRSGALSNTAGSSGGRKNFIPAGGRASRSRPAPARPTPEMGKRVSKSSQPKANGRLFRSAKKDGAPAPIRSRGPGEHDYKKKDDGKGDE